MKFIHGIFLFLILSGISCAPVDVSGVVTSSDVDDRFTESMNLPEKNNLSFLDTNFSFIVITDTHIYQKKNQNLESLKNKIRPDDKFILVCGDITQCGYSEDFQAFCSYMNQINLPCYTAIGNHDLYFKNWPNYKQVMGKSCYSFIAGPARIISMDSANGTIGEKQKNWLERTLKTKTESLCFVFTHFAFFSPETDSLQQYTDTNEVYYLMHLFEANGVNYVFMGHTHISDFHKVNTISYLTLKDFEDDGHSKEFIRVSVSGSNVKYERISL